MCHLCYGTHCHCTGRVSSCQRRMPRHNCQPMAPTVADALLGNVVQSTRSTCEILMFAFAREYVSALASICLAAMSAAENKGRIMFAQQRLERKKIEVSLDEALSSDSGTDIENEYCSLNPRVKRYSRAHAAVARSVTRWIDDCRLRIR
eukprot:TRINITY_DN21246_c0_g1_i2.p2 TRINITY_DN21246_c0_g1~~TRINITY_DN21246_c0_g1_i2.p2  ORF type:complete len:149 (-),score=6.21 TRINITY_DN21246_c0_g1_i2:189-635(-)